MPAPHATMNLLRNVGGGIVVALLGVLLAGCPSSTPFSRLSYDIPFVLRETIPATNAVIVYVNEDTLDELGAEADGTLHRSNHARLLDKLAREQARLVFFDFVFSASNQVAQVDQEFARALRAHPAVVLGAQCYRDAGGQRAMDRIKAPTLILRRAARGWGLVELAFDPDNGVRQSFRNHPDHTNATWVAAEMLGASVTREPGRPLAERWLNYYGPPTDGYGRSPVFVTCSLEQALATNGVTPDFFRDKIVFVGAGSTLGTVGQLKENFASPYTRFGWGYSAGVEVHATTLLNLLNHDWLERLDLRVQALTAGAWGLLIGCLLVRLRPGRAALAALAAMMVIAAASYWLQWERHLWWSWTVPVMAQTPLALIWSVGFQYGVEALKRRKLRKAFSSYLSPYMADQIAESNVDLSLGGQVVEATIMFTDLADFTTMSEEFKDDPTAVSNILTTYFNRTTGHILEQQGTIIKYIGDAVMAVWGAPLPDDQQSERAVLAAWGMIQAGREQIQGRTLRTRIGINTGKALAGNLGSTFRFDYTVIGDTTNFAARLEGFNKYLGTDILISESTRKRLSDRILVRDLGRFVAKGKTEAMRIYEVLGPAGTATESPEWMDRFKTALELFAQREFDRADAAFREVIARRGGKDGPAEFYLQQIARVRGTQLPEGWDGAIVFDSK